ncbi:MAG: FAD-binding oxidoreductase [Nitriliruptorales bacterium]|nr:FAD-binding oxidoreductase [Nitriliruptorales bacterium]
MTRRRSWWGWGWVDEQLGGEALDGLGSMLAERFSTAPTEALPAPEVGDVEVAEPRVSIPDALAVEVSATPEDRLFHGHGQAFRDVVRAVEGRAANPPDAVAYPESPQGVARLLDWASDEGVDVVPFGGGTSVVGGVEPRGARAAVSLDLSRVSRVLEVDGVSRAARIQAGARGPEIEDQLRPHGLTLRHFPQSWEFSTLGGWLATRAGGHYATRLTHIDDMTEAITAITPAGEWVSRRLPGSGAGPSPDRLLLGSEGTLGVITSAWMRVQPRPVHRASATVRFADVAAGARAVRALGQSGLDPANCRLLDPTEAALSGAGDGSGAVLVLGFESADHPLGAWIDRGLELCRDHGGAHDDPVVREGDRTGTAEGGEGAWRETFLRAPYLRDALVRLGMVVETLETAVTWDAFDGFVAAVRDALSRAAAEVCGEAVVGLRLTHVYPDGAAPYFTVIAPGRPGERLAQWDEIKAAASDVILAAGGTITHHHAVGRDHVPWYERQRPDRFGDALAAAKRAVDPAGIMNPGVLGLG